MKSIAWLLAGLVIMALGGCGGGSDGDAVVSRDAWAPLRVEGSEVEWFESVEDIADAADLVVVGHVSEVAPGRVIDDADDPAAGSVGFVDVTVDVAEVLSGELPGDGESVTVEFFAPAVEGEDAVDELDELVNSGDLVLFLRDKGKGIDGVDPLPEERGLWRIVNSHALVAETEEQPVDVPLAEEMVDSDEPAQSLSDDGEHAVDEIHDEWDDIDAFADDIQNHLQES